MMENLAGILLFVLCLHLFGANKGANIFYKCKPGNTTLDVQNATINYKGYDYETSCEWIIPKTVITPTYGVVLAHEITYLNCQSYLTISGVSYTCKNYSDGCTVYFTDKTACDVASLLRYVPKGCNDTALWKTSGTSIVFQSGMNEKRVQRFIVQYLPIKCTKAIPETTAQTTWVTTTFDSTNRTNITALPAKTYTTMTTAFKRDYIIVAAAAAGGILLILLVGSLIAWRRKRLQDQMDELSPPIRPEMKSRRANQTYANPVVTADEDGYEIPTNARQYENLKIDSQYENLKDDIYEDVHQDDEMYVNTELSVPHEGPW